jgi:uncharacterized protein with gpF-like domain
MPWDECDKLTDEQLEALERKIHKLYKDAADEMEGTINEYFKQFEKRDAQMKTALDNGEITKQEYTQWRLTQIGRGKRYEDLRDKLAERMTKANEVAVAYVNDMTPGVYSLNMNYAAYQIEQSYGNIGFTIWNDEAVRRLAVEEPDLMPYYPQANALRRGIDLAYGKSQITSQITSSILLGHSIPQMASALQQRIQGMNDTSAIRTARTAVTAAQNGGRQATLERAADMGIKLRKRWVATKDLRTRPEHGHADGQTVPIDKPFDVGGEPLMFPGDRSNASGWNIYNCRCAMRSVEKEGIGSGSSQPMTYDEWFALRVEA